MINREKTTKEADREKIILQCAVIIQKLSGGKIAAIDIFDAAAEEDEALLKLLLLDHEKTIKN